MKDTLAELSCSTEPLTNNDFNHVFFPTLGLIALAFLLEALSHDTLNCCTTISDVDDANDAHTDATSYNAMLPGVVEKQPRPQAPPEAEASSSSSAQSPASAPEKTHTENNHTASQTSRRTFARIASSRPYSCMQVSSPSSSYVCATSEYLICVPSAQATLHSIGRVTECRYQTGGWWCCSTSCLSYVRALACYGP